MEIVKASKQFTGFLVLFENEDLRNHILTVAKNLTDKSDKFIFPTSVGWTIRNIVSGPEELRKIILSLIKLDVEYRFISSVLQRNSPALKIFSSKEKALLKKARETYMKKIRPEHNELRRKFSHRAIMIGNEIIKPCLNVIANIDAQPEEIIKLCLNNKVSNPTAALNAEELLDKTLAGASLAMPCEFNERFIRLAVEFSSFLGIKQKDWELLIGVIAKYGEARQKKEKLLKSLKARTGEK